MQLKIFLDKAALSQAAAKQTTTAVRRAIAERGRATIVAATAASQIEFLDALTRLRKSIGRTWRLSHLEEYIGLPVTHPGSFRRMLLEQLIEKTGIVRYHLLDGDVADPMKWQDASGERLRPSRRMSHFSVSVKPDTLLSTIPCRL